MKLRKQPQRYEVVLFSNVFSYPHPQSPLSNVPLGLSTKTIPGNNEKDPIFLLTIQRLNVSRMANEPAMPWLSSASLLNSLPSPTHNLNQLFTPKKSGETFPLSSFPALGRTAGRCLQAEVGGHPGCRSGALDHKGRRRPEAAPPQGVLLVEHEPPAHGGQ